MIIEIDQSNKIEETNKNTIIGMSNGKAFAVLIKGRAKRKLKEEFRKAGKQNLFKFRVFIAGVVLMIKYSGLKGISEVVIDEEYTGKDNMLRSMFLEMWKRYFEKAPIVRVDNIGRKSGAHAAAYLAMKGRNKVDREIKYEELKALCLK